MRFVFFIGNALDFYYNTLANLVHFFSIDKQAPLQYLLYPTKIGLDVLPRWPGKMAGKTLDSVQTGTNIVDSYCKK
jgi:hypothetical protein